ncbi:Abi family protein [Flavobacterium undicola]|uniref:Abi family protein n=1 Tax=Flavobacterium undicola TaxID=1932779 RepID=UPI001377853D|nr:Abi family protein [Flavobacterium undicola]MBA0884370.1 Abi family protein [Flavobacterium undicola]
MRYSDFESIMTPARMNRYLIACRGNSRKAMTLYRKNLQLTQELFTVISCFEVALRNAIDTKCVLTFGNDWLRDGAIGGGMFDNGKCRMTSKNINEAMGKLNNYTHFKLVAELGFGFWRFMFAQNQFNATNRILLKVFPSKPISTPALQYNNTYIFNQLAKLNDIRNRMAHHEPICFLPGQPVKSTTYARQHYNMILQLFQWMQINESALLYGLDHINTVCNEIDNL